MLSVEMVGAVQAISIAIAPSAPSFHFDAMMASITALLLIRSFSVVYPPPRLKQRISNRIPNNWIVTRFFVFLPKDFNCPVNRARFKLIHCVSPFSGRSAPYSRLYLTRVSWPPRSALPSGSLDKSRILVRQCTLFRTLHKSFLLS